MPVFPMQVFFKTLEGEGWSERYWWEGTTDINMLTTLMKTFAQSRALMLSQDSAVQWIRLGSNFKRDPLIFDQENDPSTEGPATNAGLNTVDDAILMRLEAPGVGYNRLFFRGIPQDCIRGMSYQPTPAFQTAFMAFRNMILTSGNFAVRAFVDNPGTPVQVLSASQGSPKGISLTVADGTTFVNIFSLRIAGASVFGYNGVKNILSGAQPTKPCVLILGGAKPPANNPTADMVTATPRTGFYAVVSQFFVERVTNRKAGRPFGLSRGRARTALSLRP